MALETKSGDIYYPQPYHGPFKDVHEKTQFASEMNALYRTGISTGWKVGNEAEYRPLSKINRDAMIVFIYRALGKPSYTPPKKSPFLDVSTKHPFYKEICWANAKKITTGWKVSKGREFRPADKVNREGMAAFLYRCTPGATKFKPKGQTFLDVKKNHQFYKEIEWMAQTGITNGWTVKKGKEFRPRDNIKRDAMAAFIVRWLKHLDTVNGHNSSATAKIASNSRLAPDLTGTTTLNDLVAKRFAVAATPDLYRTVRKQGWSKWLDDQFGMDETVDEDWIAPYQEWLPGVNKATYEARKAFEKAGKGWTGGTVEALAWQKAGFQSLRHINSPRQVNEAFTMFWLDHFSVPYPDKAATPTITLDLFIRDVALTNFPLILHAMMTSPKLWKFLDADRSTLQEKNENLPRELLELYTLGVSNGIEEDIRQLATFLTGWNFPTENLDGKQRMGFWGKTHEFTSSPVKIAGRSYKNAKDADVIPSFEQLVYDLAWDERTIEHISRKLVTHFITDDPSDSLVESVKATYRRSGGDIKEIIRTMITHKDFVKTAGSKWRRPQEMVATHQGALGTTCDLGGFMVDGPYTGSYHIVEQLRKKLALANHEPRYNFSPRGYTNVSEDWMNAASILYTVNLVKEEKSLDKSYKINNTWDEVLEYADQPSKYPTIASNIVYDVTGYVPDTKMRDIVVKALKDTSKSWEKRVADAAALALTSPYGFTA